MVKRQQSGKKDSEMLPQAGLSHLIFLNYSRFGRTIAGEPQAPTQQVLMKSTSTTRKGPVG
jgi:hypothetical protein